MRRLLASLAAAAVVAGATAMVAIGGASVPAGAVAVADGSLALDATDDVAFRAVVGRFTDTDLGAVRDAEAIVEAYFADLLRRVDPDVAPGSYWVSLLERRLARSRVTGALVASAEGRAALVAEIYEDYLRRTPSGSEAGYWAGLLGSGWRVERVRAAILAADELYRAAGATDAGWVEAAYDRALGRAASTAERDSWAAAVAARGRPAVAADIVGSAESRRRIVAGLFDRLLHRAPDAGALDHWTRVLAGGSGEPAVIGGLAASGEYVSLLPSDYEASISWGDGSPATPGSLRRTGDGRLEVTGGHTFAAPGSHQVTVTLTRQGGESAQATAEVAVAAPRTHRFAAALYQEVLARTASAGEAAFWSGALAAGGSASRVQVSLRVGGSAEGRHHRVGLMYQDYLERSPSSSEAAYWADVVAQSSLERVRSLLLASDELFVAAGGTDADWVGAVYERVLGRSASTDERSGGAARVAEVGRATYALEIVTSREARSRLVRAVIAEVLDRQASSGEVDFWAGRMTAGVLGEARLIAEVVGSTEYFGRFPLAVPRS